MIQGLGGPIGSPSPSRAHLGLPFAYREIFPLKERVCSKTHCKMGRVTRSKTQEEEGRREQSSTGAFPGAAPGAAHPELQGQREVGDLARAPLRLRVSNKQLSWSSFCLPCLACRLSAFAWLRNTNLLSYKASPPQGFIYSRE